jgi:hypothetical protein
MYMEFRVYLLYITSNNHCPVILFGFSCLVSYHRNLIKAIVDISRFDSVIIHNEDTFRL